MDSDALIAALSAALPEKLARDFVADFMRIRRDVATGSLGHSAPGKFVETLVQALQALENGGQYDAKPDVDSYLKTLESRPSNLPDGLRICAARVGRAMYSLRSKRNIVHKAELDPAAYDLQFLYGGAQWVLAELLALTAGITGAEASRLVAQVQLPVGGLVETLEGRKLVHGDLTVRDEVLVLLMSDAPKALAPADLFRSMDRRAPQSIRNAISALWRAKLIHRAEGGAVSLTEPGMREAIRVAQAHVK